MVTDDQCGIVMFRQINTVLVSYVRMFYITQAYKSCSSKIKLNSCQTWYIVETLISHIHKIGR